MNKPDNISLRDWFAGMAMQGFCSIPNIGDGYDFTSDDVAKMAYRQADAMLEYTEEVDD